MDSGRLALLAALRARLGKGQRRKFRSKRGRWLPSTNLSYEPLEERRMLACSLPDSDADLDCLAVGRTLSAYSTADIDNGEITISYRVHNLSADEATNVELEATLQSGISVVDAGPLAQVNGRDVTWQFDSIDAFGMVSVDVRVAVASPMTMQIDEGARSTATIANNQVQDDLPAASFRNDVIEASLLAATPDANSSDVFVLTKVAELDQSPQEIFEFVRDEIGFESYTGSLRGARGALWSEAGNSLDQGNLLVSMLRASGVPAQYAQGELADVDAQVLIASMFPNPLRITGFIEAGTELADPVNDPQLLAETREHFWVQMDTGTGFVDVDASFSDAGVGQSFSSADTTFWETTSDMRHQVAIRAIREITSPGAGLLTGGISQNRASVLDVDFTSAELVGRPVTVGFAGQSNSLPTPTYAFTTNVYSPFLLVGNDLLSPDQDDEIRGTDFTETLTSFPFGTEILTGLFLEIDVISPGGESETLTSTIADRIGLSARTNGGSISLDPAGVATPLVTPADLTTINVLPSSQDQRAVLRDNAEIESLAAEFQAELEAISQLPDGAEKDLRLESAARSLTSVLIGTSRARLAQIAAGSDLSTRAFADASLVRAYFDSPRIHLLHTRANEDPGNESIEFLVDLLRNAMRTEVFAGQVSEAAIGFQINRGITDTMVEAFALEPENPEGNLVAVTGVTRIFELATEQGVATRFIDASDRAQIDLLDVDASTKLFLEESLNEGRVLFAPVGKVQVNRAARFGWLEFDLESGETIGRLDDGTSGAFADRAATLAANPAFNPFLQFSLGALEALVADVTAISLAKFIASVYVSAISNSGTGVAPVDFLLKFKSVLTTMLNAASLIVNGPPLPPSFKFGFAMGLSFGYFYANDPSVDGFLLSPLPHSGLQNLQGNGGPLAIGVVHDPLLHIQRAGAEVPTVFRLGIRNLSSQTETYQIEIAGVAAGFVGEASVQQIEVPAGETAEVGLALRPVGQIGTPGSDASFSVTVTPQSNPADVVIENVDFAVPEIRGLALTSSPSASSSLPGVATTLELRLESTANVPQTVTLTADVSDGLNVTGLADLTLTPGEIVSRVITLTPAAGLSLNTELGLAIRADFGGELFTSVNIPLRVVAPGVDATARASIATRDLGDPNLADRLDELSIALTRLVENPGDDVFNSQATTALDTIINLLGVDPDLSSFVDPLVAGRDELAAATSPQQVNTAVENLGDALDDFAGTVVNISRHNFTLALLPNSQVATPLVPHTFEVIVQNVGLLLTDLDLSVSGLPASVTALFSDDTVTLARGDIARVELILRQTDDSELIATNFTVNVTAAGVTPTFEKSATGSLRVRPAFVSVTDVDVSPPFADPGTPITVSARLLNAVSRQQDAQVSYSVVSSSGESVFTSDAVAAELTVQTSLVTVNLPPLDTTGLPTGQYRVEFNVADDSGAPIPGGTGSASLLIGSPVTAEITVTPDILPPGNSTVTHTLTITGQPPSTGPICGLELASHVPIEDFTAPFNQTDSLNRVAIGDGVAYVFGELAGIHTVDISDPSAPAYLRSEDSSREVFGIVDGDRLLTVNAGQQVFGLSRLAVWGIGGSFGGTTENPVLIDAEQAGYIFAQDMVANGDIVFVSVGQVLAPSDMIEHQNGSVLAFDISDPNDVQLLDVLFNDNGTSFESPVQQLGGDFFVRGIAMADPTTLLVASSTSTGNATQEGVGRLLVVDVSDPTNINSDDPANSKVVTELEIPGTVLLEAIEVVGDIAYVTGTVNGFRSGAGGDFTPAGEIVLASVDISDPGNPVLLHTQQIPVDAAGNNVIDAVNSSCLVMRNRGEDPQTDTPQIVTVNVADSANFVIAQQLDQTAFQRGLTSDGTHVYASGDGGLFIYDVVPISSSNVPTLSVVGQLPVDDPNSDNDFNADVIHGVEVHGDIVYVFGNQGLHVVDASDADAPQLLTTKTGFSHTQGVIDDVHDRLVVINGGSLAGAGVFSNSAITTYDVGGGLGTAENPRLVTTVFPNYTSAKSPLLRSDGDVLFEVSSQLLFIPQPAGQQADFFAQNGTLLSFDLRGALNRTPRDSLLDDNGTNGQAPFNQNGGNHYMFSATLVNDSTMYVTTTTGEGGDVDTDAAGNPAVGRIMIVDVTNPADMTFVGDPDPTTTGLLIPGTMLVQSVVVDGDRALVIGSTGSWLEPFDTLEDIGPTGNIVLSMLDISDPRDPQIINTQTLDRAARGAVGAVPLGNGLFVFSSIGSVTDTSLLIVVNASDPNDIQVVQQLEVPTFFEGLDFDGTFLYATGSEGLIIYRLGGGGELPVTAQVQIPNDTGVEVVDGSFNFPPSQVIEGDEFDTLVFDLTLEGASPQQSVVWQSEITSLQPGEARNVVLDTTIDFTLDGTQGQIVLPPQTVAAEQVLSLDPAARTVRPGKPAMYSVSIANPAEAGVTYDMSVAGVPGEWVDIARQVFVAAGRSVEIPLTLTSSPFADAMDYGFTVVASTGGTTGSVQGTLTLVGDPVLPSVDPQSHGVVLSLTPVQATAGQGTSAEFVARVTNTGSTTDTFVLSTSQLPGDFEVKFQTNTVVVPPGAGNFREIVLTITPPVGTLADVYDFNVTATSTEYEGVTDDAAGTLTVVAAGVDVQLSPSSGAPNSVFELIVTNTGSETDTFNLSVAAPAALFTTLAQTSVTLQPNQTQAVPIEIGEVDFAVPGGIDLVGVATSATNEAVFDADMAVVTIEAELGVAARFQPDEVTLPNPGQTTLTLLVDNIGNLEDEYSATIVSVTGPLTASIRDLDGLPAQTVPLMRIPGLSLGTLLVDAELFDFGTGTITVLIQSLSEEAVSAEASASVFSGLEPPQLDFGDAPTSQQSGFASNYPTLLNDEGARHLLVEGGPFFGDSFGGPPDAEEDGQPHPTASGDDLTNITDEGAGSILLANAPLPAGEQTTLGFIYSAPGVLATANFWIDWNQDGDWDDAGEQLLDDRILIAIADGRLDFTITVPANAVPGNTFGRARISTQRDLGASGEATDGEVEDFIVQIRAPVGDTSIRGFSYVDVNNNGLFDSPEQPLLGTHVLLLDEQGNQLRETFTNLAGEFKFDDLQAGTYVVSHVQPSMFIDGKDTPGNLGDSDDANDQFTIQLGEGDAAVDYLFGERGLLPWYIGKSNFLASTPNNRFEELRLQDSDQWHVFDPDENTLEALLAFDEAAGDAQLQLFDAQMRPLEMQAGSDTAARWLLEPGQTHYLRISGNNNDVDLSLDFSSELVPDIADPLAGDFNGNGRVEQGDLDLVLVNWGQDSSNSDRWKGIQPNGIIDQEELDAVLLNWGK